MYIDKTKEKKYLQVLVVPYFFSLFVRVFIAIDIASKVVIVEVEPLKVAQGNGYTQPVNVTTDDLTPCIST